MESEPESENPIEERRRKIEAATEDIRKMIDERRKGKNDNRKDLKTLMTEEGKAINEIEELEDVSNAHARMLEIDNKKGLVKVVIAVIGNYRTIKAMNKIHEEKNPNNLQKSNGELVITEIFTSTASGEEVEKINRWYRETGLKKDDDRAKRREKKMQRKSEKAQH
ncbi:hypothetical protein U1Q18_051235 [Sarracenia purpurea var. burkii]